MALLKPEISVKPSIPTRVLLKLVPEVGSGKQITHKFFAIFVSFIALGGLFVLLVVNILLAQDAFVLSNLKIEAKKVADEREAIAREIDHVSSPEALAAKAQSLGMQPSDSPQFLNLIEDIQVSDG